MEITDLKYFIAIANKQNLQQVAKDIHLSASALSKSVARLEAELGRPLFLRVRQRLQLTAEGMRLREHASLIVALEENALLDIKGSQKTLNVRVSGPEACLLYAAPFLRKELSKVGHPLRFEFKSATEEEAQASVRSGESHLAVVCNTVETGLKAKSLEHLEFHTYAGKDHPLANAKRTIPIEEVLEHPFAVSDLPLFGSVSRGVSNYDGWRDDKFPRLIAYRTASLKLLEELVVSGEALGYLPEYYGDFSKMARLKISGCPYTCKQQLKLIAYRPELVSWINRLF